MRNLKMKKTYLFLETIKTASDYSDEYRNLINPQE